MNVDLGLSAGCQTNWYDGIMSSLAIRIKCAVIVGLCLHLSNERCLAADQFVCPDHSQFNSVLNEGKSVLERSSESSLGFDITSPTCGFANDSEDRIDQVRNNLAPTKTELWEVKIVTSGNIDKSVGIAVRCAYNGMFSEAINILDQVAQLTRGHPDRTAWVWESLGALHALKGTPLSRETRPLTRQFCNVSRDRLLMLDSLSRRDIPDDVYKLISRTELEKAESLYMQAVEIQRKRHDSRTLRFDLLNLMALRRLLCEPPVIQDETEILQLEEYDAPSVVAADLKNEDIFWAMEVPHAHMTAVTAQFIGDLAQRKGLPKVESELRAKYYLLTASAANQLIKDKDFMAIDLGRQILQSGQPERALPIYADVVAEIADNSNGADLVGAKTSLQSLKSVIDDIAPKVKSSDGFSKLHARAVAVKIALGHRIAKLECLKLADELNETGFKLERRAQYKAARKMYDAALKIRSINLGAQDRTTAAQITDIARLSAAEGKSPVEVKRLYEQALAVFRKQPKRNDTEYRAALESYAAFLDSRNERTKSDTLYAEARRLSD